APENFHMGGLQKRCIVCSVTIQVFLARALGATVLKDQNIIDQEGPGPVKVTGLQGCRELLDDSYCWLCFGRNGSGRCCRMLPLMRMQKAWDRH
ncbi:hypothetical protein, partial [Xanthomonas hortorum]|uniref:hypothetical protein n=1 Tax=Xanthomonas hortorum TaxID=56454 RepID=UPI0032E92D2B